jgi:hypothetical protein
MRSEAESWVEPQTRLTYPSSYARYRRVREAEEKWAPRHRTLGPDIDRYVWDRWQRSGASAAEVVLSIRSGTSPRVQRLVGEVVRAIGRGRPAAEAIRHTARRFGLRQGQARAFIAAGISFEVRRGDEPMVPRGPEASAALFCV